MKEFQTEKTVSSKISKTKGRELNQLFTSSPIPDNEILRNISIYMYPQEIKRLLFINDLYLKSIHIHGVIMEFGVRWGKNMSLLQSLRAIYEPYNHNRKIIGFDTFEGFPAVSPEDGDEPVIQKGSYGVSKNYNEYLQSLLRTLEHQSPLYEVQKFELVKGDAINTLPDYLKRHPETIISFAYFDFDIYEPTKRCLEFILPHLTKGSVIGFDELNNPQFPGETIALNEVLGLNNISIRRSKYSHTQSYIVFE